MKTSCYVRLVLARAGEGIDMLLRVLRGFFGVFLALLPLAPLCQSVAGDDAGEIFAVGVNMENTKSPRLRRILEVPNTVATLTVCLHLRILFLHISPSLIFFLQDLPYSLSVRDKKLQARVGSQMLIHKHPLPTHAWCHLCLVMGQRPELALEGNYTVDVDVTSSDDPALLLQDNATLWLGRSDNALGGLQESVGGYTTLPQVFPGRLSEDQIQSLARCEKIPNSDLAAGVWDVTGKGGELLGHLDSRNLKRLAYPHSIRPLDSIPECCIDSESGVTFELVQGMCPTHAQDQLLVLPGHYTSHQAARRCRSLRGRLPHPEEERLPGVASTVAREQGDMGITCWAASEDEYYLLKITDGKINRQSLQDETHPNASKELCCQVPLGPIAELRTHKSKYESGLFAIVPSATQLRFMSLKGDMIYVREDQLRVQMFDSWAWSMTFNGHWTGRHEVMNTSQWWQGQGRQVVVSVCSKEEFTCNNGYCLSLSARCDGHDDCGDGEDEKHCEILPERPDEHKLHRPPLSSIPINFTFSLVMIEDIDEAKLSFKAWLRLQSTWHDDSLTLWHLSHHPENNVIPIDKVPWMPSYNLDNCVFECFLQRHNPEHKVVTLTVKKLREGVPGVYDLQEGYKFNAGKEAVLMMTEDFQATIGCFFEYEIYPFDIQICDFNLSLVTRSHWRPYFNVEDMRTISRMIFMNMFTVVPIRQQCPDNLPANPSSISFRILIKRRFITYIWTTFLPCLIISAIGNMTFFFDSSNFTDRIMVALSCLIVLATLFTQDVINGPRHSSFKIMDVLLFFTLFRIFIVFTIHAGKGYLQRWLKQHAREQQVLRRGRHAMNLNDSTKNIHEVEEDMTLWEEETHRRDNRGHENKLKESQGGWVENMAKKTSPNREPTTLPQSLKLENKCPSSSSSSSSFSVSKESFLNFFMNNRKFFRVFIMLSWVVFDVIILFMLGSSVSIYRAAVRAKFEEYCDTNMD